jgi:hypothetical protein
VTVSERPQPALARDSASAHVGDGA